MKPWKYVLSVLLLSLPCAWAAPIPSSARTAIPAEVQQIITVDYRTLKNSNTAMALKQQVLPPGVKTFEDQLKSVGINPDRDVDQLTFASYRSPKLGTKVVGAAQGSFSSKIVLKKMRLNKVKPLKYHDTDIYPMSGGMDMTFLDDNVLLFGDGDALKGALDARDGVQPNFDSNSSMADMMAAVDGAPVWSLLDQQGTQNMMRSALGDAAKVADYDTVKKRLVGSCYTMTFSNGVNFDLDVITSDSMTAATMSSLIKAGMMYKKMNATPIEKTAIDAVTVDSDSSKLQLRFKSDDKQFQSLMRSELFAAVSR